MIGSSVQTTDYSWFDVSRSPETRLADPRLDGLIRQYHALMSAATFLSGASYELSAPLGKGRQGIVYRAVRRGERECVTQHAIKFYHPANYVDADAYWQDMIRIARQVSEMHRNRCPNLVDTDFYSEIDGVGLVQMELIDGINLGQVLPLYHKLRLKSGHPLHGFKSLFNQFEGRCCMQPGVVTYVMRQMLAGLENLHAASYLHCDIKPSNVMVDAQGYIRLIDLGRATRFDDDVSHALTTPAYAPPEYHSGGGFSVQSDIYSVGLVGLELLCGRPLIPRDSVLSRPQLYEIKVGLVQDLDQLVPSYVSCNRELIAILRRFLNPDPTFRFRDALAAESSDEGLAKVHRQLTRMDIDTDYRRDLAGFVKYYETR
ncbi:MAG: serine/threonine-protein kinase [Verrucomicrobiota bacterium]